MSTYEQLSLMLEGLVVIILITEFIYDAVWNNREAQLKRRKSGRKKWDFKSLTTGESK